MTPDTHGPDADDMRAVRDVVVASRSSFYWGMRLLPPPRRHAMFTVYALCRRLDDIADGGAPAAERLAALDAWADEIEALYAGRPRESLTRALLPAVRRFDLAKTELLELVEGMRMDVRGQMVGPSLADLRLYCRRAAGTVGMLSVAVFGRTDEAARGFALALGDALQLTNILRDIHEDALNGRLYLPRELLGRHGVPSHDPQAALAHPAIPAVCTELTELAERRYEEARAALDAGTRRGLRPAVIMMAVYQRLLQRLKARGWHDLQVRPRLGRAELLRVTLGHLLARS